MPRLHDFLSKLRTDTLMGHQHQSSADKKKMPVCSRCHKAIGSASEQSSAVQSKLCASCQSDEMQRISRTIDSQPRHGVEKWIIDDTLYFTDEYVNHLVRTGVKNMIVLVSSWSESMVEHARSIKLGSRQCRDLVHHILLAQKLKNKGIRLEIKYFSFDNTIHFNYKNPKATDNAISKSYIEYICSFLGIRLNVDLDENQFQPIYLNPRFTTKEGDYISAELPDEISLRGYALFCSGPNAKKLEELRDELARKKRAGYKVLGMTAHSGGPSLEQLVEYLGTKLIGIAEANNELGTKPGNKRLFMESPVPGGVRLPIAYGTTLERKNLEELYQDSYQVALKTGARRLVVKLTSSSAGNGNAFVNLSSCYTVDGVLDYHSVCKTVEQKLIEMNFISKIREHGAIVEERLEGENITSPGVLAVVTKSGFVKVLYKYDQVLGDGNFFGGSIGPTLESDDMKNEIDRLTVEVGKRIHRRGGYGYFGLDFFTREVVENNRQVKKVDLIEANIRKTGTLYPWLSALHLLGEELIDKKTISQDDNVKLPLKMLDLTGRRDMKNLYMSGLYKFLTNNEKVTFNHSTKTGAFVTFNTHTADKIGVLFIGNSRDHIDNIKSNFISELKRYSYQIFIPQLAKNNPACQDLPSLQAQHALHLHDSLANEYVQKSFLTLRRASVQKSVLPSSSDKMINPAQQSISRDYFGIAGRHIMLRADRLGLVDKGRETVRETRSAYSLSMTVPSSPHFDQIKTRMTISPDIQYGQLFVLGIFGRTNTNNDILIEASKQNKLAYRFTTGSRFWFDRQTRKGKITNVFIALFDKALKTHQVKYVDNHWFDLPTVVYDYDFTASRRGAYQAQGDRTISDKVSCAKNFISTIGAVSFNAEKEGAAKQHFISAAQSQLALYNVCKSNTVLSGLYPETQFLSGITSSDSPELAFINNHHQFYIKPALSSRKLDSNLGNIFASKFTDPNNSKNSHLLLTYICRLDDGDYYSKTSKIYLSGLTVKKFFEELNKIKQEIGYEPDEQFLFQEYIKTPDVEDSSGKSLTKKIRVVVQSAIHPVSKKVHVRTSSIYGLYGGPNSYQGYAGDPNIYIDRYLESSLSHQYKSRDRRQEVYDDIFSLAVEIQKLVETDNGPNARIGEAIVDFILTESGPVPIKLSIKPERIDVNSVQQQTHMGEFLEGDRDSRISFIDVLEMNQNERNQRLLKYAEDELHKNVFLPEEEARRSSMPGIQRVATGFQPAVSMQSASLLPMSTFATQPVNPISESMMPQFSVMVGGANFSGVQHVANPVIPYSRYQPSISQFPAGGACGYGVDRYRHMQQQATCPSTPEPLTDVRAAKFMI